MVALSGRIETEDVREYDWGSGSGTTMELLNMDHAEHMVALLGLEEFKTSKLGTEPVMVPPPHRKTCFFIAMAGKRRQSAFMGLENSGKRAFDVRFCAGESGILQTERVRSNDCLFFPWENRHI